MSRAGPLLAAAVVLVANAVALVGVTRNRAGRPEAEVLLTERELPIAPGTDENMGAFLQLEWKRLVPATELEFPWLDRAKLESLGIDCSQPIEAKDAGERYQHTGSRRAYVVLEYDGPAWACWRAARDPRGTGLPAGPIASASHLVVIDAGLDPGELRRLHPDRSRTIVAPAIVAPRIVPRSAAGPVLSGSVSLLVSEVHVPRDLAAPLAALRAADAAARPASAPHESPLPRRGGPPRYEVLLRYGARLEPWVAEVRLIR